MKRVIAVFIAGLMLVSTGVFAESKEFDREKTQKFTNTFAKHFNQFGLDAYKVVELPREHKLVKMSLALSRYLFQFEKDMKAGQSVTQLKAKYKDGFYPKLRQTAVTFKATTKAYSHDRMQKRWKIMSSYNSAIYKQLFPPEPWTRVGEDVRDNLTGLTWSKALGGPDPRAAAQFAKNKGYRLPTKEELILVQQHGLWDQNGDGCAWTISSDPNTFVNVQSGSIHYGSSWDTPCWDQVRGVK